jgi:hypothetical protein
MLLVGAFTILCIYEFIHCIYNLVDGRCVTHVPPVPKRTKTSLAGSAGVPAPWPPGRRMFGKQYRKRRSDRKKDDTICSTQDDKTAGAEAKPGVEAQCQDANHATDQVSVNTPDQSPSVTPPRPEVEGMGPGEQVSNAVSVGQPSVGIASPPVASHGFVAVTRTVVRRASGFAVTIVYSVLCLLSFTLATFKKVSFFFLSMPFVILTLIARVIWLTFALPFSCIFAIQLACWFALCGACKAVRRASLQLGGGVMNLLRRSVGYPSSRLCNVDVPDHLDREISNEQHGDQVCCHSAAAVDSRQAPAHRATSKPEVSECACQACLFMHTSAPTHGEATHQEPQTENTIVPLSNTNENCKNAVKHKNTTTSSSSLTTACPCASASDICVPIVHDVSCCLHYDNTSVNTTTSSSREDHNSSQNAKMHPPGLEPKTSHIGAPGASITTTMRDDINVGKPNTTPTTKTSHTTTKPRHTKSARNM